MLRQSNSSLVLGAYSVSACIAIRGRRIWAYDGSVWSKANKNGFGTSNNWSISTLLADGKNLYAGTDNFTSGCEVWTTGAGNSIPLVWRESPFRDPGRARRK